jgi:hypothetical protein
MMRFSPPEVVRILSWQVMSNPLCGLVWQVTAAVSSGAISIVVEAETAVVRISEVASRVVIVSAPTAAVVEEGTTSAGTTDTAPIGTGSAPEGIPMARVSSGIMENPLKTRPVGLVTVQEKVSPTMSQAKGVTLPSPGGANSMMAPSEA